MSPFACQALGGNLGILPAQSQSLELACVASNTASCAGAVGFVGKTCEPPSVMSPVLGLSRMGSSFRQGDNY